MDKSEQDKYFDGMMGWTINAVEDKIIDLNGRIGEISAINERFREDPRRAFREMKERQLQDALEAYGKVDLHAEDIDRIPIIFARLQADEAAARRDLKTINQMVDGEKKLKKQLEIAKKVLTQKTSTGGRA